MGCLGQRLRRCDGRGWGPLRCRWQGPRGTCWHRLCLCRRCGPHRRVHGGRRRRGSGWCGGAGEGLARGRGIRRGGRMGGRGRLGRRRCCHRRHARWACWRGRIKPPRWCRPARRGGRWRGQQLRRCNGRGLRPFEGRWQWLRGSRALRRSLCRGSMPHRSGLFGRRLRGNKSWGVAGEGRVRGKGMRRGRRRGGRGRWGRRRRFHQRHARRACLRS